MAIQLVQMGLFGGDFAPERPFSADAGFEPGIRLPPALPVAPKADMVRIAPDRHAWIPRSAATPPDEYVLCRWSKQPDGTYAPVPFAGRWARLNSRLAALLGFQYEGERCRYDTILRLGNAEFIDLVRVAPNTWMLDLDSWFRHLAECMDNPERWDEGSDDRKIYLDKNGLGTGWKHLVR